MILKNLGEFNFIKRIARKIKVSNGTVKGIGDDAAVLRYGKNQYLLFTADMLIEGRHFRKREKSYSVGKKALSVNISDIAAMGGVPKEGVVSIGVPARTATRYADGIYRGIRDTARKFKIDIVGGDTVSSDRLIINISLLGRVNKKDVVYRSGAKPGDAVFVTGSVGGSIKGKHLDFTPRLAEALFLVKNFGINSMIDISDGLLADLGHILEASGKGALIYKSLVPVSKKARTFASGVADGEDFELLFTLSARDVKKLKNKWPFRTLLTEIGTVVSRPKEIILVDLKNKKSKITPKGYRHF